MGGNPITDREHYQVLGQVVRFFPHAQEQQRKTTAARTGGKQVHLKMARSTPIIQLHRAVRLAHQAAHPTQLASRRVQSSKDQSVLDATRLCRWEGQQGWIEVRTWRKWSVTKAVDHAEGSLQYQVIVGATNKNVEKV